VNGGMERGDSCPHLYLTGGWGRELSSFTRKSARNKYADSSETSDLISVIYLPSGPEHSCREGAGVPQTSWTLQCSLR
jgi:hypothetical protein